MRSISFDDVYDSSVSQSALFNAEVLPHLQRRIFGGHAATLFAYGDQLSFEDLRYTADPHDTAQSVA